MADEGRVGSSMLTVLVRRSAETGDGPRVMVGVVRSIILAVLSRVFDPDPPIGGARICLSEIYLSHSVGEAASDVGERRDALDICRL